MFSNNISTIVFAVILLVRTSGFLETPLHSRLLLDERSFILHGSTTENEIRIVQKQYNDDFIRQELENMDETTLPRWAKDIVAEARPIRTDHDGVLESSEFPMSLFVDQNLIKKALVLAAVNQRIGGVVIYGGSGTGKSTLIRTMEQLLPKSLDDSISSDTMPPPQNDTETASTPHVTVPLNVMEDALIGSVDIEKSLKAGSPVFSPGLLAKANRGVLYIDDINLLEEEVGSVIMNVLADGYVQVEREGLSLKYPCRPLLLATFNPQEGEVREHLLDRVGISLPVGASEMKIPERVQVVQNVESFLDKTLDNTCLNKVSVEKLKLEDRIVNARKLLPTVEIDHDQMLYLCEEATRADCEGQRAEVFATEIAKASAAFDGRENVNAKDLQVGILLAIAPRARNVGRDVEQSQPERQPPPDQSPPENSNKEEDQSEEDTDPENEKASPEPLSVPEEFMFGVDSVPIDPMLIHLQNLARRGKGGKSSRLFNLKRGRFVKSIFPKANARGRIAIGATLRAAAPYQIIRRKRARARNDKEKLVHIRKGRFSRVISAFYPFSCFLIRSA